MIKQNVRVKVLSGIHFRPAGKITENALKYDSEITIMSKEKKCNAKSFLNLLAACIKYNDEIEVICEGPDEQQALEEMISLLENDILEENKK